MKTHELSILQAFADAIYNGDKTFELTENDREYQKGDHIKFTVRNSLTLKQINHALNDCEYEITYVLSGWGLKENYVVLAIKRLNI